MSVPSAMRFNYGKLELSMVPASLTAYCAAPLMYGAIKYSRDNWRQGFRWNSLIDSLQRHLDQFKSGEDFDTESGIHHLGHVACNVAFLIEHVEQGLGTDDRTKLLSTEIKFLRKLPSTTPGETAEGRDRVSSEGSSKPAAGQ